MNKTLQQQSHILNFFKHFELEGAQRFDFFLTLEGDPEQRRRKCIGGERELFFLGEKHESRKKGKNTYHEGVIEKMKMKPQTTVWNTMVLQIDEGFVL